jgi:hypothetical protein
LTWLQTFRHEAAHLLSLDDSNFRSSPVWFQEGVAESLAGERTDPWYSQDLWRDGLHEKDLGQPVTELWEGLSAEGLLQARQLVAESAIRVGGATPWQQAGDWTIQDFLNSAGLPAAKKRINLMTQLGREFDPPSEASSSFLATYPGQTCTAVVEPLWGGGSRQWGIRLGSSGSAEGGLLVSGEGPNQLRLRFGRTGGFGAQMETKGAVGFQPLGSPTPARAGKERQVKLVVQGNQLLVEMENLRESFSLDDKFRPPFRVEAWAHDSAMSVKGRSSFLEASLRLR